MTQAFREDEEKKAQPKVLVPVRKDGPLHSPLDSIGRSAAHSRHTSESVHSSPKAADRHVRIARNKDRIGLTGMESLLPEQFAKHIVAPLKTTKG